MYIYVLLLEHVRNLMAEAASLKSHGLIAAAKAFDQKLRKYVERSTSDSEYYYFASGMVLNYLIADRYGC